MDNAFLSDQRRRQIEDVKGFFNNKKKKMKEILNTISIFENKVLLVSSDGYY